MYGREVQLTLPTGRGGVKAAETVAGTQIARVRQNKNKSDGVPGFKTKI